MLRKGERLSRTQFGEYFKAGRRFHSDHATVVYHPAHTFFGSVVVSKKVSKKAVVRNSIRRSVYNTLASVKQKQNTGVFIVVVKPSYATLTKQSAKTEIQTLIGRIVKTA